MMAPKQVALLSLLGVAFCLAPVAHAATCGREGQTPCDDGCEANFLPDEGEVAEWYPGADNYVPAPKGYRQDEGLCTRCGNIYEPVCIVEDKPRCFIDAQAGVIMEPTEDGYCVPPQQQFGCGTTGLPPCPDQLVQEYGTLAVLSKREESKGWQLTASLGEIKNDGCLYSVHNLVLRFVKAPREWLPEGHKCAEVCVACGVPGHPACPVSEPACMRRVSEADLEKYRDGPTYTDENGMCRALHCGSSTVTEDLPACTEGKALQVLNAANTAEDADPGFGTPLDSDGDGCVEPYTRNSDGNCEENDANDKNPAPIRMREYDCSREGMTLINTDVIDQVGAIINKQKAGTEERQNLKERLQPILDNRGKCVECGRGGDLPCFGMDFDGCMVHEGFMLDQDIGLCVSAPCGGSNLGLKSPPWNSSDCAVITPDWYTNNPEQSPINDVTNCLYFHNLVTDDDGTQHCEPCGTPGNRCIDECVMGIAFSPIGTAEKGLGEFQFLDDSIRTTGPLKDHCKPFPKVQVYDDTCAEPKRVLDDADLSSLPPARIFSPQSAPTSEDPGFGTASNPDECRHPVQAVERVYTDACPGSGGTPVSKWGQCGGQDYSGPTCCFGYSVCVQKSEFYSLCEGANVPSELIPWHAQCGGDNAGTCEPGSSCEEIDGTAYCKPERHHIPHSGDSGTDGVSRGATIGVALALLALCAVVTCGAFAYGRHRGIAKGQFKLSGWGDAENYANGSNFEAGKDAPANIGEGTTYLDIAAASEAEALHQRRQQEQNNGLEDPDALHLPTSDFGIGRRA